jgi:hypothetical protein
MYSQFSYFNPIQGLLLRLQLYDIDPASQVSTLNDVKFEKTIKINY